VTRVLSGATRVHLAALRLPGVEDLLVGDLVAAVTGRIGHQPIRTRRRIGTVVGITLGKLGHLSWALVVPLLFNSWWAV
jgi:hypothetical protein